MSHLMLSRHGIWYYRRVYSTPRKRREIRISLRTRSKREAMKRAEQYITSQPFACVPQAIPAHSYSALAAPTLLNEKKPLFPNLKNEFEKYANAKTGSVGEREILTINRCVNAYLPATKEPFSKRSAAAFVDSLEGSASTRNRYIKKDSAFSNGLRLARMKTFETRLRGWG